MTHARHLRPTRAEIDLDALAHNLSVIRATAAPSKVLAVVKADAYGHGVVPVARRLQQEGVHGLGVALAEEALELRQAGITTDIVVLNGVYGDAHQEVVRAQLTPIVHDLGAIDAFARAARAMDTTFGVHLKVDTGMARLGVPLAELEAFLARVQGVRIDGLMTHLACADSDAEFTAEQLRRFHEAVAMVRAAGHAPGVLHVANTAATFAHPATRLDMVRVGLGLFGLTGVDVDVDASLRPVMRVRSEIVALRTLQPGEPVGYGGTFRAKRPSQVATVALGYGDGLMRAQSNRGVALVRGQRCPMVGTVSMDLTTFDVTDVSQVAVGDEVVLLGSQQGACVAAQEVADAAGTIPYEVWCAISRRVPRIYS